MTIKYECDRCHEQFDDDLLLTSVTIEKRLHTLTEKPRVTLYYCRDCAPCLLDGLNNINKGTFDKEVRGE